MLRFFDRLNLTPSERRLVVVIAVVAFLVLNYWLVWPRFGDYQQLAEEIRALERKRRIYEAEIARRPHYEATLRKLQETGTVLPAGEERIQFRADMERLARQVGLIVPRWGEVLPERSIGSGTNAFFESLSLTATHVTGTEEQFVEFLYRVGAGNSTIRVKDLTLAPGAFDPRSQGKTNLVGTIKLVASVQKAAPAANAPASAAGPAPAGAAPSSQAAPAPVPTPARSTASAPPGGEGASMTTPVKPGPDSATPIPARAATRTNAAPALPGPRP